MTRLPDIVYPPHPAHIAAYVEVLGPKLALRFFLEFGGTTSLYFPNDPKGKSAAEALIGPERLRALGERMNCQRADIPRPRTWIIHALKAEGCRQAEICRLAGCTSETVRRALKLSPSGASLAPGGDAPKDSGQLSLF